MTTAILPRATPWGDRTRLLPKSMLYVLSLDVEVKAVGPYLTVQPSDQVGLRHLFDEAVVTLPEGLSCDVPSGEVEDGDGEIGTAGDPASPSLRMRVRTNLGTAGRLNLECVGVVNIRGGSVALQSAQVESLSGSSFISTYQEASSSAYRWLNRRQLFGVGRFTGKRGESGQRMLTFSFDLYAAL